jgi:hypothetical protein
MLSGASPETYIGFKADVPKRDAVVAAFKVRYTPAFASLTSNLLGPVARLARIRYVLSLYLRARS